MTGNILPGFYFVGKSLFLYPKNKKSLANFALDVAEQ